MTSPATSAHGGRRRSITSIVEVAGGLVITLLVLGQREVRALIAAIAWGLRSAAGSTVSLLAADTAPTAGDAVIMAGTIVLMALPPLRLFLRGRRRHLVWVPLWLTAMALASAVAPLGMGMIEKRIAFVAAFVVGWIFAARPGTGWLVIAPMIVAAHPTLTSHGGPLSDLIWPPDRLEKRCRANDGQRPSNLSIGYLTPHHYAVTQIDDDLVVMTGERGSHRLRRGADGRFAFDGSLHFSGNLWQGSLGEDRLFYTHRGSGLVAVPLSEVEGEGHFFKQQMPPLPDAPPELDMLDAVYEPTTGSVFLSELVRGGAWEYKLEHGSLRHHDLRAFYLQLVRRNPDAMIVGISTTDLLVFDPRRGIVVERTAAAIGAGGLDVCQHDGAAAVTDFAGRLRLFEIDESGRYRFRGGISLSSPRRVAFSPDCTYIAVTSADDVNAWVVEREDLSVWRTFRLGPGLRDVVYTAPREVAIVDACTVNLLPGGPP